MANKYRYRWGPMIDRSIAKTGTIAVEQGDMMKFTSSGKITPATASADSTALVGVAMDASPATDPTALPLRTIEIGHGTVFEMTIASAATHTFGQGFVISGNQELTVKSGMVNLFITGTNVVAICAQDNIAAVTGAELLVEFLPGRFQNTITSS